MKAHSDYAIPKQSVVVVTGVNGFLGSHIAYQFLHYGFNVRGVVRDLRKTRWISDLFKAEFGDDRFELRLVEYPGAKGALDDIIQGAAAVVHTASVLSMSPNPYDVIPDNIALALNVLKSAYKAVTVKRFVYTSSSSASVIPQPGQAKAIVTEDTWNTEAIDKAWANPPYTPNRILFVYGASKAQAEQEVWKYHKQHRAGRPDLVLNTVVPNVNIGRPLNPSTQGWPSSSALSYKLWKGEVTPLHRIVLPQYYIDVNDTGRLHVATAILPHVQDQRIFGFAGRFNWDQVLDIFRRHHPDREFPPNFSDGQDPNEVTPRFKAEKLLLQLGREGWTSLEEAVLKNIEGAD